MEEMDWQNRVVRDTGRAIFIVARLIFSGSSWADRHSGKVSGWFRRR